jgi:hypothetical protein
MTTRKAPKKVKPLPKTAAGCIDQAYTVRAERKALEKTVNELKARQTALTDKAATLLRKEGLDSGRGTVASLSIKPVDQPSVEDWDTFYTWVKRKGNFAALQRRLGDKYLRDLREDGKQTPGVRWELIDKHSLTKR